MEVFKIMLENKQFLDIDGLQLYNSQLNATHIQNYNNPHLVTKAQVGLSKVDNKSSEEIRNEITSENIIEALGFNPAGASTVGGAADSANKLTTSAGSVTQPVYFKDGKPVATTHTLDKSVPSDAVFTDTTYSVATSSENGLMSSIDKTKLEGIEEGATRIFVDSLLSSTSTHPVQNKVITSALADKAPMYTYSSTDITAGTSSLTSGSLYFVYE